MKPFYQGKLDVFCAIYAVLNALRLTHGLRGLKARDILHDTLLALAENKAAFKAVLDQQTDYIPLVDAMLQVHAHNYPMRVALPFSLVGENAPLPDPEDLWYALQSWLDGTPRRAVIFRFARYLLPDAPPLNRHWSTISHLEGDLCRLYDASHEPEAVYQIRHDAFVTDAALISQERLLCIDPYSLRCIERV